MLTRRVVTATIQGLMQLLCQVDGAELARVPGRGPLILAANHVNFLDVPLLFTRLQPRPMVTMVKAETWDNPVLGWLFDTAGGRAAIPVQRGEVDREALRRCLAALAAGDILALAPEGTRSGDGRLQRGQPGVTLLALHSGAPILPVVYYGHEVFSRNFKRLRRTTLKIRVGQPFYLEPGGARVSREMRQQMTDEIMYQLAALLPPDYRGVYADLAAASATYLRFPDGAASHPPRAQN